MLSRFMTRREQWVLCFVAAAIVLGSGVLVWVQSDGAGEAVPESMEPGMESSVSAVGAAPVVMPRVVEEEGVAEVQGIVVSVQGAVVGAGVYEFSAVQRVNDAIEAAGGLMSIGNTEGINLAAKLVDGTTLYIPKKRSETVMEQTTIPGLEKNHPEYLLNGVSVAGGGVHVGNSNSGSGLINLNTASQAELESLPGIGPVYAQSIIAYRTRSPFTRIEDIQQVRGIGEKRFDGMRELISVQ